MPKYINAGKLCEDLMSRWKIADKEKEKEIQSLMADVVTPIVVGQPAADVVEIPEGGIEDISDGYHTFRDLYYQRMVLFATIVKQNKELAWKSLRHEDGELCFGGDWFIVGIDTPEGSYTYHYETNFWSMFDCQELERGKHWDGHTDKDITRLLSLISKEVKHSKWMDGKYFLWKAKDKSAKGFHTATCSNCNITQSVMVYQGKIKYNFCPYCGADMRKEKK